MKKVKITVLRATFNEDLALEYGMPGLKPCSVMKQGQVFYAAHAKPDGFCDGAWRTIYQYVFALANGARSFYYNDWIRQPGVAIACCNDGLRPVFFKLEATDEEVEAEFQKMADEYNIDLETVKKYLQAEQVKDQLKSQKAIAVVVDSATAVKAEKKPAKKTAKRAEDAEGEEAAEEKPAKKTTRKKADEDGEEKKPAKKATKKAAAKKEEETPAESK